MYWNYEDLWMKAVVYMDRAFENEQRESELFPFWATIGLEFVGRSILAKVHPSLLADGREGEHIMYACGYSIAKTAKFPKSVPSNTVFTRLKEVVSNFTENDKVFVTNMMNRRNEELHSGSFGFHGLKPMEWLTDFYRICKLFCDHLGRPLGDLLGEEAAIAEETITTANEKVTGEAKKKIAAFATIYSGFDEQKKKDAIEKSIPLLISRYPNTKVSCPSCKNKALLFGKIVKTSEPKLKGDTVFSEDVHLTTSLQCHVCGLQLNNRIELNAADIHPQYTVLSETSAWEYYNENTDNVYEGEYNNS